MSFDSNNKYQLPELLRRVLFKEIAKFMSFGPRANEEEKPYYRRLKEELKTEYKELRNLLVQLEDEDYPLENENSTATVKGNTKSYEEEMKDIAIYEIKKILEKLRQQRIQEHTENEILCSTDNEGWNVVGRKPEDIAHDIWSAWWKELETRPRAGIIFVYPGEGNKIEIPLIRHMKDGVRNYGFPKGKINLNETTEQCAAREAEEETGINQQFILDHIKDRPPIIKKVYDVTCGKYIDHYYYICLVKPEDLEFNLNPQEVNGIEWRSIYDLPCGRDCSVINQKGSNYFMVMCNYQSNQASLIQDIIKRVESMDKSYNISEQYQKIHKNCIGNKFFNH